MEKNFYKNMNAIVILGGTSFDNYIHKLKNIDKKKNIIFIETKCISRKLLDFDIYPDYIICPFSIKLKDNYFQNIIYRSIMAGVNILKFIKEDYHHDANLILSNKNQYFEVWRPQKGMHKKLKYKKDVYLKNSPYENLSNFPNSKIFLDINDFVENFSEIKFKNKIIKISFENSDKEFNLDEYFDIKFKNDKLIFKDTNFLNSQSICHFPLLKYLGFEKVFFLGMDMNFFGSYEYDFRKIFKSKIHFYLFLFLIRKTLNGNMKMNFPIYLRPKSEFENLKNIISEKNNFYRVINGKNYCKIPKINEIKVNEFIRNLN